MRRWPAILALAVGTAASLPAQESADLLIEGRLAHWRVAGSAASSGVPLSGNALGAGVRVRWWWLVAEPRYQEGTISSSTGGVRWDVVEGELMLGLQPMRWATVSAGPLIRSFLTPDGTRRTIAWQGRLRFESLLLVRGIRSYLDLWRVMSADANTVQLMDGGYGGEAGLRVAIPGTPATWGASYRIDRTEFGGGLWMETVETVSVGLGLAFGHPRR